MRSDTEYNAIYSYCMVHFIYRLNLFGGKGAAREWADRVEVLGLVLDRDMDLADSKVERIYRKVNSTFAYFCLFPDYS